MTFTMNILKNIFQIFKDFYHENIEKYFFNFYRTFNKKIFKNILWENSIIFLVLKY